MDRYGKTAALLLSLVLATGLSACGGNEPVEEEVTPPPEITEPLFSEGDRVVDGDGNPVEGLHMTEDGTLVDENGNPVATAEAVEQYVKVDGIEIVLPEDALVPQEEEPEDGDKEPLPENVVELALDAEATRYDKPAYIPKDIAVIVSLKPENATNREFEVKSSNSEVAEIGTVSASVSGDSLFTIRCKAEGTATITVTSADGVSAAKDLAVTLAEYVDPTKAGWVTAEVANLRDSAEHTGSLLGSYAWGKEIRIYERGDVWSFVNIDGIDGYILSSDVSYAKPERYVRPDPGIPDNLDDMIDGRGAVVGDPDSSIIG